MSTIKIAYCKCGVKIICAAIMPFAETNRNCQKDFARFAKQGRKIEIVPSEKMDELFLCNEKNCDTCENNKNKQLNIF